MPSGHSYINFPWIGGLISHNTHACCPLPGFGGIFPQVDWDNDKDGHACLDLFQHRLELAADLPVAALTGFNNEIEDDEVAASTRAVASTRLAKVLRARAGNTALASLRGTHTTLRELAIGMDHFLSSALSTAASGCSEADGGRETTDRGNMTGQSMTSPLNEFGMMLGLVSSLVVQQVEQNDNVARHAMGTLVALVVHLESLAAAAAADKTELESVEVEGSKSIQFEGFSQQSLNQFMELLGKVAKDGPSDSKHDAVDLLVRLAVVRGGIHHVMHALVLLSGSQRQLESESRLVSFMLKPVATVLEQEPVATEQEQAHATQMLQNVVLEYFEKGAQDDDTLCFLRTLCVSLVRLLLERGERDGGGVELNGHPNLKMDR